ncbi:MAG: HAD-IA family hydrolase [Pseudohongiellaceae bacterium]|nr:HAD-IA family hydrolase [Pseudohongiellaceae bacterium]
MNSEQQLSPEAVLFDLDGTLIDTAPDFQLAISALCDEAGIEPPSPSDIHATVSNGARALLELVFAYDQNHPDFPVQLERLLTLYAKQLESSKAVLYPDMEQLLSDLDERSIKWGIVTNKPERFCIPILQQLALDTRCAALVCPDHVIQSKPHPEPILLACSQIGVEPTRAIYIGDHPRDIQAGQAARLPSIAVAYGYVPSSPPISQWGADYIAKDVAHLARLIGLPTAALADHII